MKDQTAGFAGFKDEIAVADVSAQDFDTGFPQFRLRASADRPYGSAVEPAESLNNVFPEEARESVTPDTDFLLNLFVSFPKIFSSFRMAN